MFEEDIIWGDATNGGYMPRAGMTLLDLANFRKKYEVK